MNPEREDTTGMSPAKPDQQLAAAESNVQRAQADHAQAQADLTAATDRAAEAQAQSEAAAQRRDTADPFRGDKAFLAAHQDAEVAQAKAVVLENRVPEAVARVESTQAALAAAERERDRVRLAGLQREIAESEAALAAMVREMRVPFVARLRAHRELVAVARGVAVSVHGYARANPDSDYDHTLMMDVAAPSEWCLSTVDLTRDCLPERGALAAAEQLTDRQDYGAWKKEHPPVPSPWEAEAERLRKEAENRRVDEMLAAALERRDYLRRLRTRPQLGETVPRHESPGAAVRSAIDAKVQRDRAALSTLDD